MPPTATTEYCFASVKEINEPDRTVDIIASTSDLDRHGDIVKPEAFEASLAAFVANPVVLATHHHRLDSGSSPVIGSVVTDSIRIMKREVRCTIRFAETALGEEYWQLYRQGHMKAVSIGFIPLEWTDEKDEQLGYIRTYTKIELLEISAVPVPSNRRALVRFLEMAGGDDIESIGDKIAAVAVDIADLKSFVEQSVDEIKTLVTPDSDEFAGELMLGCSPDPLDPAGAETAEPLDRIKNACKEFADEYERS